jgi:spore germination protein
MHKVVASYSFPLTMVKIFFIFLLVWIQSIVSCAQAAGANNTFIPDPKQTSDTVEWEKKRYVPAKGMLNKFKGLFKTLHGANNKVRFQRSPDLTEIVYDSSTNTYYNHKSNPQGLAAGREVFGWHPHWMKEAYKYYPYKLLSTIAFFAYDINPENGTYNDADAISQWRNTTMIDSAKQNNVKVLLTLTSYGADRNNYFLSNEKAWLALSDSVRFLLRQRKADGVDLDFSGITMRMKTEFLDFVSYLRNKLGDSTIITLQIPYQAVQDGYDLMKLKPLVNTFILQGFDHDNKKCGNKPVPLAPLLSREVACSSIEKAVNHCLLAGLEEKNIVVSIPLYGALWKYKNSKWNFAEYIPYEDIRARYGTTQQQFMEEVSGSSFIRIGETADHSIIWYEGEGSLKRKFQWIKDKKLQGAGLWGLGYDGSHPEIWNTVKNSFGVNPWQKIQPIGYDNGKTYTIIQSIQHYRKPIGIALFIIICFFIAGLLLSCLDWRVRAAFFHNNSYRAMLAGAIVLATLLGVYLLTDNTDSGKFSLSTFSYGVLLGGAIVYAISSVYMYYRKRLH